MVSKDYKRGYEDARNYYEGYNYRLKCKITKLEDREEKVKGYLENLKNYEKYEKKHGKLSRKIMLIEEGLTMGYKINRIANNILWFYEDENYRKDLFKRKESK